MNNNKRLREILVQFIVYISLFIGTGFLSGAIVHFPIDPMRFAFIGIIGTIIFVAASTINEAHFNEKDFKEEGLVKVIFFSLILSLGIGMISGGVQHFEEYPHYASILIPLGAVVSLLGYILKSNLRLSSKQVMKLFSFTAVIVLLLGAGLHVLAKNIDSESSSHGHQDVSSNTSESEDHNDHAVAVTDDKSFIQGMVPHHEEAIVASEEILTVTKNPKIRTLAQNIIKAQQNEVAQMKGWHQDWFNEAYQDNGLYEPMMQSVEGKSEHEAEETYLQGMIEHHRAAIAMAQSILQKTQRPELKTVANDIVLAQNQEIQVMQNLLQEIEGVTASDGHDNH